MKYPVFTQESKCHDCYKCVRECFVKSIEVKNSQANIIKNKCIACGHCVRVCPQGAKKIRFDIDKAKALIASGKKVIASLAPSWAGVFDMDEAEIVSYLKSLGFYGVSETAIGAENVSIQTANILNEMKQGLLISSACPVVVDYIRFYKSEFAPFITKLGSPALTHAKFLKETFGEDIKVIFIGPCIAKKNESDRNQELISAAITFDELSFWMKEVETPINKENSGFIPKSAHEGAYYPIEGGMNETIRLKGVKEDVYLITTSSLPSLERALLNLDPKNIKGKIFIEALSCEGGCVNGPGINIKKPGAIINSEILSKVKKRENIPNSAETILNMEYEIRNYEENISVDDILNAMKSIGKSSEEDELNCGGCGYQTCMELAIAIASKKAEPSMCVSYMRQLGSKKTAMLLASMPSGMVLTNGNLEILETNNAFLEMFDMPKIDLKGAMLDKIVPFASFFEDALQKNEKVLTKKYQDKSKLYEINIFVIEEENTIGAIITDVTESEFNRKKVAKMAREAINKNIETVQNIAGLLGEHMVEVETLLNSIAEDYE